MPRTNRNRKDPLSLLEEAVGMWPSDTKSLERVEEIYAEITELHEELQDTIRMVRFTQRGPQGEKGDRGEDGLQGLQGERGEKGERGADGLPGKDGRNGKDGKDGKDGLHAVFDKESIISELLKRLVDKKLLKKEHVFGLSEELSSVRSLAGKQYGKDTWARGGGDTVAAGTNITITESGGKKVINSTGGSSFSIETPTGDVDASNTIFTPTQEPLYVVADGVQYFDGAGYTWNSPNIEMDIPPSQYIRDAIS